MALYKGILAGASGNPPAGGQTQRTFGTGQRRNTLLSTIFTNVKTGALGDLYNECPAIGQLYTDGIQPAAYTMDAVVVPITDAPQLGRLTVVTEFRNGNPIYEIDWQMIERPLELNPIYQPMGTQALSTTDLAALAQWKAGGFTSAAFSALTSEAQNYATKFLNGQTSYYVFAPVARKITNAWIALTVGSLLGTYSTTAPFPGCPADYQWLAITDRGRKEGAYWERTQEWLGADSWDSDLYEAT